MPSHNPPETPHNQRNSRSIDDHLEQDQESRLLNFVDSGYPPEQGQSPYDSNFPSSASFYPPGNHHSEPYRPIMEQDDSHRKNDLSSTYSLSLAPGSGHTYLVPGTDSLFYQSHSSQHFLYRYDQEVHVNSNLPYLDNSQQYLPISTMDRPLEPSIPRSEAQPSPPSHVQTLSEREISMYYNTVDHSPYLQIRTADNGSSASMPTSTDAGIRCLVSSLPVRDIRIDLDSGRLQSRKDIVSCYPIAT